MLKKITFTKFKELMRTMPLKDIKVLKSLEVTGDGKLGFIMVIPKTAFERESVRKLAGVGNNVHGGKDI